MLNNVKDYIVVFENAITHELCDSIIKEFNDDNEWRKTVVDYGVLREDIRSAETIIISQPHVIEKNLENRKNLDKYLYISVGEVIKKYSKKFPHCTIQEDSGYELLRYKEGKFYTQHTDSCKGNPRSVSCSLALNDDYEGGEWGFFDREMVIKAPKGSAVLFPSNFMYPHEIMPVTKGTRYSVITWFI